MPKKPFQSDFHNLIAELLTEQGVRTTNGVLEQLIHFSHGFVTQLRGTAQDLTSGSEAVSVEDIHLANDLRSFPQSRIQQQDIHRLASRVNTRPFPRIERHQSLSLPNEEKCLLAINYQYGKLNGEMDNKSEAGIKKRKSRSEGPPPQTSQRNQKSAKREEIDFTELEAEIAAELEAGLETENKKNPTPANSSDLEREDKDGSHQVKNEGVNGNDDRKITPAKGVSVKSVDVTKRGDQDRVEVRF